MRLNIVKLTRTNQTMMNVSDIFSLRKRNCKLLTMMPTKIFFKTRNFVNFKWIRAKSYMPFGSVGSTRQASTSHYVQCYSSVFKRGCEPVTIPIDRNLLSACGNENSSFWSKYYVLCFLVKLIFDMQTVHGRLHSFSTHGRLFMTRKCRKFLETENISNWRGKYYCVLAKYHCNPYGWDFYSTRWSYYKELLTASYIIGQQTIN